MADNLHYREEFIKTGNAIAKEVDNMMNMVETQRRSFERRWYDNQFFDDGYHFRYVSRSTGKIVDLSKRSNMNMPTRAIPKASRQIRGVANLLLQPDYTPVVYPDEYASKQDPKIAKDEAQKIGLWLMDEWDTQELQEKLMEMVIGSAKQSVYYMKIWMDDKEEKINTSVRDSFDIYLMGNLTNLEDQPFIIEAHPKLVSEIKANPLFPEEKTKQIHPDNKFASSEVKEAYMKSRYGSGTESDQGATLIQKEAFIKDQITEHNAEQILGLMKQGEDIEDLNLGDTVMRHVFTAGGITLYEEYLNLDEYPYVDFRFEPGPLYQVPLIERFIPANKSLDIAMSRVEKYMNTMVTGTWLKRKGESFDITNVSGGQVIEYKGQPPVQGNMANVPGFVFNYMEALNRIIEEQGASTSALGQIPSGVKSGVAIESLKATEYANLKIPSTMLKGTVRRIGEKMIKIASDFVYPKTVQRIENGEPNYFQIMGQRGAIARMNMNEPIPDAVIVKNDYKVDVEVESGLGFTMEGKKESMQQIVQFMLELAQLGVLTQEAIQIVVNKMLEIYQFGSTQEFMEALDEGGPINQMSGEQLMQMKIAVAEALKDTGMVGPEKQEEDVQTTKVGVAETLRDLGMGGQDAR